MNASEIQTYAQSPEQKLEDQYRIGDIVRISGSLRESSWLLVEPIHDSPEGLIAGALEIDSTGKVVGFPGTILATNIKEIVDTRMTKDEIVNAYLGVFTRKDIKLPEEDRATVVRSVTKYFDNEEPYVATS